MHLGKVLFWQSRGLKCHWNKFSTFTFVSVYYAFPISAEHFIPSPALFFKVKNDFLGWYRPWKTESQTSKTFTFSISVLEDSLSDLSRGYQFSHEFTNFLYVYSLHWGISLTGHRSHRGFIFWWISRPVVVEEMMIILASRLCGLFLPFRFQQASLLSVA